MAEKRSKSILSGLKNMLHLEPEKPSKPAPASKTRKPAAEKRAAPPREAKEQRPAPAREAKEQQPAKPAAAAPATPDAGTEPKPEKAKVKAQPWYRHRQRW